jgi:general secretion pathway protein F
MSSAGGGIPLRELAVGFRGLATIHAAGVPLEKAIRAMMASADPRVRAALETVVDGLVRGEPLHRCLDATDAMPESVIAMARAGERAGRLDEALGEIADYLEYECDVREGVLRAITYPCILLAAGCGSMAILVLVVLPRFANLLAELGQQLPPAAHLLLQAGTVFRRSLPVLLPLGLGLVPALHRGTRTGAGRRAWHAVLQRLPVIGGVRRGFASARALRAIGGAVAAGMSMAAALDLARDAASDAVTSASLGRAALRVEAGQSLSAALHQEGDLEPVALQLLAVGETSGRVAPMALQASALVRRAAERRLHAMTTMLEPLLILVFGGLVAVLAAVLLQAVYGLRPPA